MEAIMDTKDMVFNTLMDRGYIYQSTNIDKVEQNLKDKRVTFYLGIDPTADSLHIGHFFALMMFKRLQEAGHKGILVIGGATALIGDPSGKSDMRKMLTKESVERNLAEVKQLVKKFIKTDGDNPAIILNNADWFKGYDYVDFMRDIGINFNIAKMLSTDIYANRIKQGGLTFLEMGYMLMQAYDFVYLNKKYGCTLEIGGSDQWGNIIAGTSLYKKLNSENQREEIVGLTCPLLLTKDGKKMGKTEKGTLWVAREKTTPYDFYQYFYNIDDENVNMLLRLFTDIDLNKIDSMCRDNILLAKKTMAYEITKLVHGEEEAKKAVEAAKGFFSQGSLENCPQYKIPESMIKKGIDIISLAVNCGLVASKSEARRMIEQSGLSLNGEKVSDISMAVTLEEFNNDALILKKGKKTFVKITVDHNVDVKKKISSNDSLKEYHEYRSKIANKSQNKFNEKVSNNANDKLKSR